MRIPEHLSYEEASTLPVAAVSVYSAFMGGANPLKAGDTVLVQNTGGISTFGLQIAAAAGATVIAMSSSDAKLELAKKLGATHVINRQKTPEWDKEVLRLTNGRGVDHVLDVGGPATLMRSVGCVRYGGTVHTVGFLSGVRDLLGRTGLLADSHLSEARARRVPTLTGSQSCSSERRSLFAEIWSDPVFGASLRSCSLLRRQGVFTEACRFEELCRMISATRLRPVIDKVFDFEHLRDAYEYMATQQHVGKIIVKVA